MTWVVGSPTLWGYGFGLSDIRVTLENGAEIDCLQKIYPVGRYVAAGFAGDVQIGFRMIDELRRLADLRDEGVSCDPHSIAREWPRCARQVFAEFPDENRAGECALMIISAHPREHNGNPAWPRSYVQIFRSPVFEAEIVNAHTLGSIGCGAAYRPCREASRRTIIDGRAGGVLSITGPASTPALSLSATAKECRA